MLERPIGQCAMFVFYYRCKRQSQYRPDDPNEGVELQFFPAAAHGNAGIGLLIHERHSLAIARECVRGPLARRSEIEFLAAGQALAGDVELAARMLPEPGSAAHRTRLGISEGG